MFSEQQKEGKPQHVWGCFVLRNYDIVASCLETSLINKKTEKGAVFFFFEYLIINTTLYKETSLNFSST